MIRKLNIVFLVAFFTMMFSGCSDSEITQLPGRIQTFITTYFPDGYISSVSETSSGYVAQIRDGATLTFDKDCAWTDVNGNGEVLPEVFVYDQLPQKFYVYLHSLEEAGGIYRVARDAGQVKVWLKNTNITYDVSTGEVHYPTAGD